MRSTRRPCRAYVRTWYGDLVPETVTIDDGHVLPPMGPGIGTTLLPDVARRADARVQITRLEHQ